MTIPKDEMQKIQRDSRGMRLHLASGERPQLVFQATYAVTSSRRKHSYSELSLGLSIWWSLGKRKRTSCNVGERQGGPEPGISGGDPVYLSFKTSNSTLFSSGADTLN